MSRLILNSTSSVQRQANMSIQKLNSFCTTLLLFNPTSLQVTDYAIARRIVDLHSRLGEAVERIYSVVSSCSCSA